MYLIPEPDGGWRQSSPWAHNEYVRSTNNALGYKVKPLIRLLKALKYFRNIPISSFYLELRIAKYCQSESSIFYEHDILRMLNNLVNDNLAAVRDPMGISGNISACATDLQKLDALSKLQTAQTRACNAIAVEKAGKHVDALYWWRMVFDREI